MHSGDSLSVDSAVVAKATGHDPRERPVLPVVAGYGTRMPTTWQALYTWLRERVLETPGIPFEEGRAIATVTDSGEGVRVTFADGTDRVVAAVIGADGYRSLVRRTIVSDVPYARDARVLGVARTGECDLAA